MPRAAGDRALLAVAVMEMRRCERLPARLPIEVRSGGRRIQCFSRDVSRHGLFILTEAPPPERQLLALRVTLPDGAAPVDVVGSVAHRVTTDDSIRSGAQAGMGIGFFVLSGEAKARWDGYIDGVAAQAGGPAPAPAQRGSTRPTFLLRLRDLNRLMEFRTRELRLGAMFLKTPVLRAVGDVVQLVVIHPVTDEEFTLTASVTATSQGSPTEPKGMSLKISALDVDRDAAFDIFVAGEPLPVAERKTQIALNPLIAEPPAARAPAAPELPDDETADLDLDLEEAAPEAPTLVPGLDPNAELRRAVDRDPDAIGPRLRLGAALAREKSTAPEAVSLLRSILERESQHPLAHGALALAHAQLGERGEAERHLTRALRLGHVDPELERRVRGS
ncbi:MAG: PilZ domain-containing protein [Myxococcales bacterium]